MHKRREFSVADPSSHTHTINADDARCFRAVDQLWEIAIRHVLHTSDSPGRR